MGFINAIITGFVVRPMENVPGDRNRKVEDKRRGIVVNDQLSIIKVTEGIRHLPDLLRNVHQ